MRLLSWNIHKGIGGLDRRYQLERVADVLRHHDADVVMLQEVDCGVPRSHRDDQAALLGEELGYRHALYGPNVTLKHGHYGNALLTHPEVIESSNINLSFPLKKKRGGLHALLEARVGRHRYRVHVVNLHLGLSGLERSWQVRKLLRSRELAHLDGRSRLIVGGDTNDWTGTLWPRQLEPSGFSLATGRGRRALRSFPAWAPTGALDKVFLRGPLAVRRARLSRLALARAASDHLPLLIDLDLSAP